MKPTLPNGRLPESPPVEVTDIDTLRGRIQELELLCAEVYVAAVEIGLPQPLLNRLWTVAAHGSTPHAFALDLPPSPPARAAVAPIPLPDIKLTDRPGRDAQARPKAVKPELDPLPVRRHVMVVDDDPMMMEVLVRILQRENYELTVAASGSEALHKAAALPHPLELLITDYAMPGMRGHELAERMRERYPGLRVLYQTGFSDMLFENKVELEEGAAFLEKPFTARGLREAARFILFGAINPIA
ncbi:MAG TPA: response regulator [Vicinamibacterales bacterium]|nr:response regulator [Vicinamibacterales bacterium]